MIFVSTTWTKGDKTYWVTTDGKDFYCCTQKGDFNVAMKLDLKTNKKLKFVPIGGEKMTMVPV